jgi:hypothetical protein
MLTLSHSQLQQYLSTQTDASSTTNADVEPRTKRLLLNTSLKINIFTELSVMRCYIFDDTKILFSFNTTTTLESCGARTSVMKTDFAQHCTIYSHASVSGDSHSVLLSFTSRERTRGMVMCRRRGKSASKWSPQKVTIWVLF